MQARLNHDRERLHLRTLQHRRRIPDRSTHHRVPQEAGRPDHKPQVLPRRHSKPARRVQVRIEDAQARLHLQRQRRRPQLYTLRTRSDRRRRQIDPRAERRRGATPQEGQNRRPRTLDRRCSSSSGHRKTTRSVARKDRPSLRPPRTARRSPHTSAVGTQQANSSQEPRARRRRPGSQERSNSSSTSRDSGRSRSRPANT